ncbi:KAP family P-loop domain-containing protein [Saccharopolyspora antimicrobica]|uniref:KAP family P-loop domain-containing protein n=1 Tax=Saccharopolyspora antimicrobica TaxID=455193 RepID=A0A1I5G8Y0_9PSEU|nr:P-loop NTPase fold protein [Saccharopolyspora antimicrobica]RKT83865.1 KAP-like P-loop domain-containing protein [Saccharopolyspora antimicrobica]SFO32538.1 KAP family P-loop domain-containing protein [Saccharopolyspora antimicrobica]
MTSSKPRFVSQAPARAEDGQERLFRTREKFHNNLEHIADHIVYSQAGGGGNDGWGSSMTFAIYGEWGSGKSTSLEYIKYLAAEAAKRNELQQPRFTHFSAPVWERHGDVRAALSYEILHQFAPGQLGLFAGKLSQLRGVEVSSPVAYTHEDADFYANVAYFDALGRIPSAPPLLEEWIRAEIRQENADNPVPPYVVLVDDLDRCSPKFTAELLAAMNYWDTSTSIDLFFILAASREHLLASLREHLPLGARYPEQALEKYVHVEIAVPRMLSDHREIGDYLAVLFEQAVQRADLDSERRLEFVEFLRQSVERYPNGPLAPLLEYERGSTTPRSIKHRLNTFLTEFAPQAKLTDELLKQWVVKAFWPDFWSEHVRPASADPDGAAFGATLERVTAIGDVLLPQCHLEHGELVPMVEFLARSMGIDPVPPELAVYLAREPRFAYRSPEEGVAIDNTEAQFHRQKAQQLREPADYDAYRLSLLAEQEFRNGDSDKARECLLEIARIAENSGTERVSTGRAALIAERMMETELALRLYNHALRIESDNYNLIYNYLDFVLSEQLSEQLSELLPQVEALLERLRTGESDLPPDQVKALVVRLGVVKDMPEAQLQAGIDELLDHLSEEPTFEGLTTILRIGHDVLGPQRIRRACRVVAESGLNDEELYRTLRLLADGLGSFSDNTEEVESAEIYRFLLFSGISQVREADEDTIALKNNLSMQLVGLNFHRAAALLLQEVYAFRPNDLATRRALAQILDRLGWEQEATGVMLGHEVSDIPLEPEPEVAHRFDPDIDPWWERLVRSGLEPPEGRGPDWLRLSR